MSPEAQMKIMELCKGMTIKQVDRRLALMQRHIATKQLSLRLKVTGLYKEDQIFEFIKEWWEVRSFLKQKYNIKKVVAQPRAKMRIKKKDTG